MLALFINTIDTHWHALQCHKKKKKLKIVEADNTGLS